MQLINRKLIVLCIVIIGTIGLVNASASSLSFYDILPPELPGACSELQLGPEFELVFHTYAIGVQIYKWTGTSWGFIEPSAQLYADPNHRGRVGSHYGGPTWESNSGSTVVGKRMNGCSPDIGSIPWLLLEGLTSEGPGVFADIKRIQRVNTNGGNPPAIAGTTVGQEARVPYSAEYYFYKLAD